MIKNAIIKATFYIDLSAITLSIMMIWLINGCGNDTIFKATIVLCILHLAIMYKLRTIEKDLRASHRQEVKAKLNNIMPLL